MTVRPSPSTRLPTSRQSQLLFRYSVWDSQEQGPLAALTGQAPTFTRATTAKYMGSTQTLGTVSAGQPRYDAVLNTVSGLYEPTLLLEGTRVNLCLQSENFGTTWAVVGTPTRTAAAVTVGDLVLDLLGDDDGAVAEYYYQNGSFFTGDGVKAVSVFVKEGTNPHVSGSIVELFDSTAALDRLFATVTWVAGVPTLLMATGTYIGSVALANGVYRLLFQSTAVTAANSHRAYLRPTTSTAANIGNIYAGGYQLEDAPFPSSYVKTTTVAVTREADDLTYPVGWAVQDNFTVYVRMARPTWADMAGTLEYAGFASQGATAPRWEVYATNGSRDLAANLYDGVTAASRITAIPAGEFVEVAVQFADVSTAGKTRLDVGAGFTAYSTTTGPIASLTPTMAFGLLVGSIAPTTGLTHVAVASGLKTLAEMQLLSRSDPGNTASPELTLASLRDVGTPFELPGESVITRVVWDEEVWELWEDTIDQPLDQRPLDGLLAFDASQTYDQVDSNAVGIGRDQVYRYPGHIPDVELLGPVFGPRAPQPGFKQSVSEEIFFRWGRGAGEIVFPCLPAVTSLVGEYVINSVDYSPIPEPSVTPPGWPITVRPKDYPTRTPRQILQIVKRSESPSGPELRLLVVGPVSADPPPGLGVLIVPTLSIAADANLPKNLAVVTVTNFALVTADPATRVELQYAISNFTPASWTPLGSLYPTGTGVIGTPLVPAGSHVWARARTLHNDGRVSAWSTEVDVDLVDLLPPSSFLITPTSDTTADLTWVNGEPTVPINVEVKEASSSAWILWNYATPGSTTFPLLLPKTATLYDVQIFHEEYPPLSRRSTAVSGQITTGGVPLILTPPTDPQVTTGDGFMQLCVRSGYSAAAFVFEYKLVLTDPYSRLTRLIGQPLGSVACAFFWAPYDTPTGPACIRVRHEQLGLDPSTWVEACADPWADVVPGTLTQELLFDDSGSTILDDAGNAIYAEVP